MIGRLIARARSALTPSKPRTRLQQDLVRSVGRAVAAGVPIAEIEECLTIERILSRYEDRKTERLTPWDCMDRGRM